MPALKNALVLCCLLTVASLALAQNTKPVKPKEVPVQKVKPPKLKSSLGSRSDTSVVSVDEANQLILLPLTIVDDKKNKYSISSYQCLYKRKGVTENEETGKVTPVYSIVAEVFKTTPLPEIWKKTITEQLKPGEEISFFDIVAKDAQGRLMFAPNLKLVIQ
jgi:hypothetical protein